MDIENPPLFISDTLVLMNTEWGEHRKQYDLHHALVLCRRLNYISETMSWFSHLNVPCVYLPSRRSQSEQGLPYPLQ